MMALPARILFFILFLLGASCTSVEICDDDYNSYLVARFMALKDGEPADSTVSSLSLYGIREGKPDSLLYNQTPNILEFEVPLDPHHNFSRFVLQLGDPSDTLVINHHQEIYMISYDCGFGNAFLLESLDYSSGMIKDAEIKNTLVDAKTEEDDLHIWLYL